MGDRTRFRHADDADQDGLVARVEHYPDQSDECTIYPADADDDALVTRWLTAKAGSYVSLAEMR